MAGLATYDCQLMAGGTVFSLFSTNMLCVLQLINLYFKNVFCVLQCTSKIYTFVPQTVHGSTRFYTSVLQPVHGSTPRFPSRFTVLPGSTPRFPKPVHGSPRLPKISYIAWNRPVPRREPGNRICRPLIKSLNLRRRLLCPL